MPVTPVAPIAPPTKLELFMTHLRSNLDQYRTVKNIPFGTPVVLEFTGNNRVIRVHYPTFVGTPWLGDFRFDGTRLFKLVQLVPFELTDIILDYDEGFSTALSAKSTDFGTDQFEFLGLVINDVNATNTVEGLSPITLTADVTYQNAAGAVKLSGIAAEFTIVSGNAAVLTREGVLTPMQVLVDRDIMVRARYITNQGNRFASKTITIKANDFLIGDHLVIFGPTTVLGGSSTGLVAAIEYTNGTTEAVNPQWSVNRAYSAISQAGVLTVKNIQSSVSTVRVQADVSFDGEMYSATSDIEVTRVGSAPISSRFGVATSDIADYQQFISDMASYSAEGVRAGTFTASSGVGTRVFFAYPASYGVAARIHNLTTDTDDDFNAPVTRTIPFNNEDIAWLIYESKFDNKSGMWEIS